MEKKVNTGKVFLIAGSEPLGSAGVQADIKAITRKEIPQESKQ